MNGVAPDACFRVFVIKLGRRDAFACKRGPGPSYLVPTPPEDCAVAQLAQPVEPFGEVNVFRRQPGGYQIVATILMEPDIEVARCGLALDASASMKKMYGANVPVGGLFSKAVG